MRKEIYHYVKHKYKTVPEYPWRTLPDYAVLRHEENRKWYGVIMDLTWNQLGEKSSDPVEAMNIKCDPIEGEFLRKEKGIYPAYHMNKFHWISVVLDGTVPLDHIQVLIDTSFQLTKPKEKK